MNADISAEVAAGDGLTLAQAAKLLPGRNGRPVSPGTLFRWATKGVKARDGRTVRLETARVGTAWCTTRGAVSRFVSALSVPVTPQQPSPRSAAAEAGRTLAELGL